MRTKNIGGVGLWAYVGLFIYTEPDTYHGDKKPFDKPANLSNFMKFFMGSQAPEN